MLTASGARLVWRPACEGAKGRERWMNLSVVVAMLGGFCPREVGEDGVGDAEQAEGRRIYREGGVEAGPKLRVPSAHCHTEKFRLIVCGWTGFAAQWAGAAHGVVRAKIR